MKYTPGKQLNVTVEWSALLVYVREALGLNFTSEISCPD
jgi:hypothetical protein